MQPNGPTQEHAAALCRLRRAQIAEAARIRHVVADNYLLTPVHLLSPCRVAVRAEARHVAMWLMRTRLTWPLPTHNRAFPATRIGRLLGHRDRSTVMHGVAVIAARLASGRGEDASLRQMVRAIGATLDATYEDEGVPHQRAA
jgi:chromosomal replication initiation ATPase DnaA